MTEYPVVVLYNFPVETPEAHGAHWQESDAGVLNEVAAVEAALAELGRPFRRAGVRRLEDIPKALQGNPGAIVFNLVERLDGGVSRFNSVPAVCEALGHPCTGGTSDSLSLTLDKWLSKARLRAWGIGVPAGLAVPPGGAVDRAALCAPPWIVKPLCSDGSEGIDADSLVPERFDALVAAVRRAHESCDGQAVLVEQFIAGREFNLSLLEGDGGVQILPLAEIDFALFPAGRPHIVDYAVKWIPGTIPGRISPRQVPARVDEETAQAIREPALRAWHACECRDYVRVDMRLDAAGRPFVLEVNTNPDLSPKAGFPAALAAGGVAFPEFVRQLLRNAEARRTPKP